MITNQAKSYTEGNCGTINKIKTVLHKFDQITRTAQEKKKRKQEVRESKKINLNELCILKDIEKSCCSENMIEIGKMKKEDESNIHFLSPVLHLFINLVLRGCFLFSCLKLQS